MAERTAERRRRCAPTSPTASIDTVVVAIADMQGRLQGKRFDARYFLDDVARARHRGLQLPARRRHRDEHRRRATRSRPGSAATATSSWRPTSTRCAACRGSRAPRCCSPTCSGSTARRSSSRRGRSCGASSTASPSAAGPRIVGTELEFIVFDDTYEAGLGQAATPTSTPSNQYNVDYSILGTSRVEPLLRAIRLGMRDAGHAGRVGQGRVQPRASTRSRSSTTDALTHLRQPRHLQERRQGDRGAAGLGADLHGEVQRARGQLLPHPPVAARRRRRRRSSPATASTAASRRCSSTSSPASWPGCAS